MNPQSLIEVLRGVSACEKHHCCPGDCSCHNPLNNAADCDSCALKIIAALGAEAMKAITSRKNGIDLDLDPVEYDEEDEEARKYDLALDQAAEMIGESFGIAGKGE